MFQTKDEPPPVHLPSLSCRPELGTGVPHGLWNVSFQTQVLLMKWEMVHIAAAFAEQMLMKIHMNAVILQRIPTA